MQKAMRISHFLIGQKRRGRFEIKPTGAYFSQFFIRVNSMLRYDIIDISL